MNEISFGQEILKMVLLEKTKTEIMITSARKRKTGHRSRDSLRGTQILGHLGQTRVQLHAEIY